MIFLTELPASSISFVLTLIPAFNSTISSLKAIVTSSGE